MGLFKRIRVLEDEMYARRIEEKLKQYEEKYERKFKIRERYTDFGGTAFYLVMDVFYDICFLSFINKPLEKLYIALCECEGEIKIHLYDEILSKKEKESDDKE